VKIDLSFWWFVIIISVSRSLIRTDREVYLIHAGSFSNANKDKAFKIVIPFAVLLIGFIKPNKLN